VFFTIPYDQVLDVKDGHDHYIPCTFEFLSATSIVVVRQSILEVYQIRIESPGALPVHTASLCMPYPDLEDFRLTPRVTASPRLSQCIDHGNLSDRSPFPSASFPLAEDSYYLSLRWYAYDDPSGAWSQFHVPLSSLRCSSMYGNASEIPWETWSKGFCCQNGVGDCKISGGRLIYFSDSFGNRPPGHISLFDLNSSRAGKLTRPSADPLTNYPRFRTIKLDLRPGEIRVEGPHPAHLTSRSFFTLGDSLRTSSVACDDEHIIFWGVRHLFVPR
jgi:hypothetical protein